MAVYKKTYTRYDGALTDPRFRFLVLTRYSFEELRRRRFLSLVTLSSSIWPLLCGVFIYLHHNLSAIKLMDINPAKLIPINAVFFLTYLGVQSMFAFFLAAFTGPGLVSPDLVNSALPLYLSRPFSRAEYVLGRFCVLFFLLSGVTWAPGLLLFLLQAYLEPGWGWENLRIAGGLFFGSLIWIVLLSLLALALSAWVKWKPVAGALMFGVFFVAGAFSAAINEILRTKWGHLLNISHLIGSVWLTLFEEPLKRGQGAAFFRVARGGIEIPVWCCWAALIAVCAICLYMLSRRIRGFEVVRG